MKRFIGVLLLAAVVGGCARNVLNGLISPDEAARQEALQKLDGLSPADRREVLKGLMDRLGNESGNVRRRVIQALVRFGGDAVPPLTGALTSSDRRGRVAAAETLGLLAPSAKGAAATLVGLRDDPDPEMSAWVAVALQRITGAMNPSEKRLFEAVHGQIFFLAPVSMAQAAPSPAPGDLPALVKGLSSSRESVRIAAVLGLLESGIVAAPLLTSSLTSTDEAVRSGAAEILRLDRLLGSGAGGGLVEYIKASDTASREASRQEFKAINPADPAALAPFLSPERPFVVRLEALSLLGAMGPKARGQADFLVPLLEDPHPLIRRSALQAWRSLRERTPMDAGTLKKMNAAWAGLAARMKEGKADAAAALFIPAARPRYESLFRSLGPKLAVLGKRCPPALSGGDRLTPGRAVLDGSLSIDGVAMPFSVLFARGADGAWRLEEIE